MYLVSFRKQRIQNVSWYIFRVSCPSPMSLDIAFGVGQRVQLVIRGFGGAASARKTAARPASLLAGIVFILFVDDARLDPLFDSLLLGRPVHNRGLNPAVREGQHELLVLLLVRLIAVQGRAQLIDFVWNC